jgi:penicillin-binding protein 2
MNLTPFMRLLQVCLVILSVSFVFSIEGFAQKKKAAPAVKKTEIVKKDAKKDVKSAKNTEREQDKKSVKNTSKQKAETAKSDPKNEKNKKETAKQTAARKAEEARKSAERQKAEEERRQAALAEQRRREQARREAAARKLAFERGLRSETVANILEDNTEGEDLQIRRAAVEALGSRAGTVVVMEAQTGKVLTVVNQKWAVEEGFKPCSTIKLVSAAGGINEDLIDEEGNLKKQSFRMNLDDALAYSNNSYFQKIGANLGNEKMISYARALGLGEATGFNAEKETGGRLPFGNRNPRIYSHGDDFEVTPLQLAVMVSAITNGGKLVVPNTPRTKTEKAKFQPFMRREVNLPQTTLQNLVPGMLGATEYGTAKRAANNGLNVAGKTGSCIFDNTWIGLFASVAPAVNPKYAVVVITRGQSERGKYASAVAGKIYQALAPRFNRSERETLAKVPVQLKPQRKINAQTSAQIDNDEGEDSDDGDVIKANIKNSKKGAASEAEEKTETSAAIKPKENPSRKQTPKTNFSPVVIEFNRAGAEPPADSQKRATRPRVVKND